jgi:hypothetical protein
VTPPPGAKAPGVPSLDGTYDYYGGHCVNEAGHGDWVTDAIIDDFTIAGPKDVVLDRLRDLAAVGADEVAPAFLNGAIEQMERVGREIIPALRGMATTKG